MQLATTWFFCQTGLNMGGKVCNIANQLVLQQCCKTSLTYFIAQFTLAEVQLCTVITEFG